jgi:diketogulonate reductase-like aldo/keto reductase
LKYKIFGKTGFRVSEIGMGTYYDPVWIAGATVVKHHAGKESKIEAIKLGLELGINLIDTAEIYQTEHMVGEAIKGHEREKLFIASKVWPTHLKAEKLIECAEASLKKMGISYMDLYQIHFPNTKIDIKETMGALETLVDQGKIRHIGLSNFSLEQTIEAQEAMKRHEVSSIQMPYNLYRRDVESDLLPYCRTNGIPLLAYYPLAHGDLVKDQRMGDLAKKLGRTPAQLALKWLTLKEGVFPIPRASRVEYVKDNVKVSDFSLKEKELKELDSIKTD